MVTELLDDLIAGNRSDQQHEPDVIEANRMNWRLLR